MTFEEWKKTAVFCTDIRTMVHMVDQYDYDNGPVPGVVFMSPVFRKDEPNIIDDFSVTGYMYQHNGMWCMDVENIGKEFVSFENAARWLWDNWTRSQVFGQIDWSDDNLKWSTGEQLVVIDGPSFDGGMEVRAPIEYAQSQRETSCTVLPDGTIAHPLGKNFPRVVYA